MPFWLTETHEFGKNTSYHSSAFYLQNGYVPNSSSAPASHITKLVKTDDPIIFAWYLITSSKAFSTSRTMTYPERRKIPDKQGSKVTFPKSHGN